MNWRRSLMDISSLSIASVIATGLDATIYTILLYFLVHQGTISVAAAAIIAALTGGLTHYLICRLWVFRRFDPPVLRSLLLYACMSWLAAMGHGLFTEWLSQSMGAGFAWMISKLVFWLGWTYPLSRFMVFRQAAEDSRDSGPTDDRDRASDALQ